MTVNRRDTTTDFDEDAPDLSGPEWVEKFAQAQVQRGRPKAARVKVSTTLRLDPEVLEAFRAEGPGWQGRMNAALRKAAGLS